MTHNEELWTALADERRRLADELETLTSDQWSTPSQCDGWSVGEVAAHLVTPFVTPDRVFVWTMIRSLGNFDRTIRRITARTHSRHDRAAVLALLRDNAENRWLPPVKGAGPGIPLSEVIVHGQDIRRPLGLDSPVPAATVDMALAAIDDDNTRADYARRVGVINAGPQTATA